MSKRISALAMAVAFLAPALPVGAQTSIGWAGVASLCGNGRGDYRPTWSTPLAACGQGTGNHWLVWKVDSPETMARGKVVVDDFGGQSGIGVWQYDSEYKFRSGFSYWNLTDGRDGVYVRGEPPSGPVEVDFRTAEENNGDRRPMTVEITADGFTGYLLLFVLGNFRDYSWWLSTESPGEVMVEEGDEAYLFNRLDFRGTLTAEAYAMRAGGRANVNTSLTLKVDRVFVGAWTKDLTARDHMTYDGPEGPKLCNGVLPIDTGSCRWAHLVEDPAGDTELSHWSGWERGDPGTYTFRATGAGAGLRSTTNLRLWAVVPRFPGLDTSVIPPVKTGMASPEPAPASRSQSAPDEPVDTDGPQVHDDPSGEPGAVGLGAGSSAPPESVERISVAAGGPEGDDHSVEPAVTADGRYVAFSSEASNLVPGDANGVADIFVYDRQTGGTERVSVASDGTGGDGHSFAPAITADGRYVAFQSVASTLVPGDVNGAWDVFVHDRQTGRTERVSVAPDGAEGEGHSVEPVLSPDGRYVAFSSGASNLVPGDTNGSRDVFVYDRQTGTTERVSVGSDGGEGDADCFEPALSADGRYVAFSSGASNLVPGDTNGSRDVFVYDRQSGTTERVSVASDGAEGNWPWPSGSPAITADGRYVAFASYASSLVPGDTNGHRDVFVRDRQTGTTERVSVGPGGIQGNWPSDSPAITPDGRYVAFVSRASNLVPGGSILVPADADGLRDIFVYDRQTGATERISVPSGDPKGGSDSFAPAISADGRYVAFQSLASNLVPGDTNGRRDVFVRDRGQ